MPDVCVWSGSVSFIYWVWHARFPYQANHDIRYYYIYYDMLIFLFFVVKQGFIIASENFVASAMFKNDQFGCQPGIPVAWETDTRTNPEQAIFSSDQWL